MRVVVRYGPVRSRYNGLGHDSHTYALHIFYDRTPSSSTCPLQTRLAI